MQPHFHLNQAHQITMFWFPSCFLMPHPSAPQKSSVLEEKEVQNHASCSMMILYSTPSNYRIQRCNLEEASSSPDYLQLNSLQPGSCIPHQATIGSRDATHRNRQYGNSLQLGQLSPTQQPPTKDLVPSNFRIQRCNLALWP